MLSSPIYKVHITPCTGASCRLTPLERPVCLLDYEDH